MRTFEMIEPQNHILLKFISKPKYVDDFMRGRLYMNSLEYFWNEYRLEKARKWQEEMKRKKAKAKAAGARPDEDMPVALDECGTPGQMDLFEGVGGTVKDAAALGFDQDFCGALATDVSLRAEGFRYCNVSCFYRLDYRRVPNMILWDTNPSMANFGEYVVIIDDEAGFLRLVNRAMDRLGYQYLCGSVRYFPPMKDGKRMDMGHHIVFRTRESLFNLRELEQNHAIAMSHRDCFCKMDSMQAQREWRIAMYRGVKDVSAYTLELESGLEGIAHVVRTSELEDELYSMFQEGRVKQGICERWYGNTGRKELREKFYALGDYQASALAVIGESTPAGNTKTA